MDKWEAQAHKLNPASVTMPVIHALKWGGHMGKKMVADLCGHEMMEEVRHEPARIGIYFVHGTFDMVSGCQQLADRIAQQIGEHADIHLVEFSDRFTGKKIDAYAAELRETIMRHGHRQVVVIGHSRGGLVAAYFALHLARPEIEVLQLHAICSPIQGTGTASLFSRVTSILPPCLLSTENSVAQMRPGSDFIIALQNDLLKAMSSEELDAYFYGAGRDALVDWHYCHPIPMKDKRHLLPNMTVFDYHGHLSIMSSRALANLIAGRVETLGAKPASPRLTLGLR